MVALISGRMVTRKVDPRNGGQPSPQYPNDFFAGTDLWFAGQAQPAQGWSLNVTDASGGGFNPVPSAARMILRGSAIALIVPVGELATPHPSFRLSAFRHTGDYGMNPPYNWDGSVWPAVAEGLATWPQ